MSAKGAATEVTEVDRVGDARIVGMDRNDDMVSYIKDGTAVGSVARKSFAESFIGVHLLHRLNTDGMKVCPTGRPPASIRCPKASAPA